MGNRKIRIAGLVVLVVSIVSFIPLWFSINYWGDLYSKIYNQMQLSSIPQSVYNGDTVKLAYYNSMQSMYNPYFIAASIGIVIGITLILSTFNGARKEIILNE